MARYARIQALSGQLYSLAIPSLSRTRSPPFSATNLKKTAGNLLDKSNNGHGLATSILYELASASEELSKPTGWSDQLVASLAHVVCLYHLLEQVFA